MKPLGKTLRNKLEKTVKEARDIAEAAARASLEQLGVGEASPFAYLSEDQKELRRKLRAHGRQLGDQRDSETGTQEISRLLEEVAYEHWHRMLFARFLAENNLLMYPDPVDPVAVTLEECEDMAADEGAKNGWELASRYAARMLPQIFRPDSPVFQLILPPEHQQKLERLLADLPYEVFNASDSLGWVYQFWQAKKKKEINDAGVKIGAHELPIVTQLFTEPYMVNFLLDNSLGAWWAARRLTEEDLKNAVNEEELRKKASLSSVPLEYLRFVKTEDGKWILATGTFDGWPEHLSELKLLDPCCGSGHFLVAVFLMLVPMRMELEKLSTQEAVEAVLIDNLHGLEIDRRCVELAAFSLALTAWSYPNAGGYRALPELHIACSGLSISAKKSEWLNLADDNSNLHLALDELYKQFENSPLLGSLIDLNKDLFKGTLIDIEWEDISQILNKAFSKEKDYEITEMSAVAQGVSKAAQLLSTKYNWILTNVPYLGMRRMDSSLYSFCNNKFERSKSDIATVFIERFAGWIPGGYACLVSPQNWLVQPAYTKFREWFLKSCRVCSIAQLGENGFDSQQAAGAFVALSIFQFNKMKEKDFRFSAVKLNDINSPEEKAIELIHRKFTFASQSEQYDNPQHKISFEGQGQKDLIEKYAIAPQGIKSGDDEKWVLYFWEPMLSKSWQFVQGAVNVKTLYGGRERVIDWSTYGKGMIRPRIDSPALGKYGVAISQTRNKAATIYSGELFLSTLAPVVPHNQNNIVTLWEYCSSSKFREEVSRISPGLFATNSSILLTPITPIEWKEWSQKAVTVFPNGLPKPYSSDPIQWIFHGHPAQSDEPLQVAVARLLGYRWPTELDKEIELSDEARAWVNKCEELIPYADEDGIVCIPPVRGEASAADQLLNLLSASYGSSWSNDKLSELLKQADHAGKPLETWMREKFFTQHCKLFQHRPFIWHIWDGLRDGFAALVNYHKLDKKLLETLIYTYLGDWISRQKQDIANGVDGSQEKLDAAESLKKKLELILEGEAPYDIFVRWKPIEKQPIGWDPDLNDGVRLNIRPFMSVPDMSKKGAGVLRDKPNINWNKDRGTDVESAPWYNPDPKKHPNYKGKEGERINDYHLSLKQKKEAREAAK